MEFIKTFFHIFSIFYLDRSEKAWYDVRKQDETIHMFRKTERNKEDSP